MVVPTLKTTLLLFFITSSSDISVKLGMIEILKVFYFEDYLRPNRQRLASLAQKQEHIYEMIFDVTIRTVFK